MGKEEQLLECWRDLSPSAQEQVLALAKSLKPQDTQKKFVPKTPLAHKLWNIRQNAIAAGMELLQESELEEKLAERRGGYRE